MKQFYNSLIFKLVLVFLIAAIIPLSMSAVLFYLQEVSIVEKREMHYGQKVLEMTAREINDEIDGYFRRIFLLSQQYSVVNDEISIDDKLREFRLVTDYCEYIDDINLLDLEGNVRCSLNYNYQGSWASKSWYQMAVSGRVSISPVYLQPVTQKSIIAVNVPVLGKNKQVKAVLSANLDLEGVLRDIFVKEDSDSSYFILVDNEGKILSHPDIDYVLDAYPNKIVSDLFENYASGSVSFKSPDNDSQINNCHMMTIKSSSDLADLGWKLAIVREATDVNQTNATIFIHIAGIFITGLIFVIIISLASARIIIKPIIEITSVADQIAEGDFNVSIDNDSADEIGDLCRSINEMAIKLQNATTSKNELAGEVAYYEQLERQLKNARNKAENASRAKDELLACVSHEVRTPLNAIIGYTESLILDNAVPAYSVKLKTILNESEHLLCLLNDILDNAKIQSGKFDIDLQPCNLLNAVESVTQLVKPKAVQKGLKLNLTISEDMPCYVITDSLRIRQVILNLLTNAVKFTNYGFVELKLDLLAFDGKKARVKFSVSDSGIGISKDKQMVIFESYTQADSSTSRKYGGTGLGTTISKNIIDLMGGVMEVESQVGVGSTFWFELDMAVCDLQQVVALEKEKNKSDTEISDYNLRGLKVLLAEDYQTSQNLITSQLKRLDVECDLANNGRQAVELALANDYDIILMDLQMPEMDGIAATKQIRSSGGNKADIVIIAMTACVDPEVKKNCLSAGMNDIIAKPLRICNLANMLDIWAKKSGKFTAGCALDTLELSSEQLSDVAEIDNAGLWDRQTAAELFGNNEVMLEITLKNFISDVNRQVGIIQDAIEANDLEIVRAEAHKIRGGASCVAADSLAARAAELERQAKANISDNLKARLSDLEYEFNRFTDQAKR